MSPDSASDPEPAKPPAEKPAANVLLDAMRGKWLIAAGVVAWLVSIIGPAISFDVRYEMYNNIDVQYRAYFQLLCTVLFLLAWKPLGRLPLWALAGVTLASLLLFVSYSFAVQGWTCPYPDGTRFVRSAQYSAEMLAQLTPAELKLPCGTIMSESVDPNHNPYSVWNKGGMDGMVARFLMLFGLYSLAWLSIALLIAGAVRHAMRERPTG